MAEQPKTELPSQPKVLEILDDSHLRDTLSDDEAKKQAKFLLEHMYTMNITPLKRKGLALYIYEHLKDDVKCPTDTYYVFYVNICDILMDPQQYAKYYNKQSEVEEYLRRCCRHPDFFNIWSVYMLTN